MTALAQEINDGQTMLERALALYELGFHVFPLGGAGETPPPYILKRFGTAEEAALQWPKTPRIEWKEFQTRAPSEDEIRSWWSRWPDANIAIVTGPQIFVVDADTAEVADWCESGAITRTPWKVTTGRGVQYYYQANELDVRNMASDAKLDVRGTGGYVVAPGSTHANGNRYRLITDDQYDADSPSDLPYLSSADLGAIHGYTGVGPGEFLFDGSKVSLKATGEPVAEGGRNNAAASLAGQFIQKGHSLADVKALLSRWNATNSPPLPVDELDHTIASIAVTHAREHGPLLVEQRKPEKAKKKDGPSVYTVRELLDPDSTPKKPEFFWGGSLLFKGCRLMVAGEAKAGKSRFLLDMSKELAIGGTFLGEPVKRPLRVLYMNAEIHEAWLMDRFRPMLRGLSDQELTLLKANLAISGRLNLDVLNAVDNDLIREIVEHYRPDHIVFDPVINFSSASENDNTEIRAVMRAFDALGEDYGCSIALVHHLNKGAAGKFQQGPFERIRGASVFRGWYDTGIVLTPVTQGSPEVTVAYETRNAQSPAAHNIIWDDDAGRMVRQDFSGDAPPPVRQQPEFQKPLDLRRAETLLREMLSGTFPSADGWYDKDWMKKRARYHSFGSSSTIDNALKHLHETLGVEYESGPNWARWRVPVDPETGEILLPTFDELVASWEL